MKQKDSGPITGNINAEQQPPMPNPQVKKGLSSLANQRKMASAMVSPKFSSRLQFGQTSMQNQNHLAKSPMLNN